MPLIKVKAKVKVLILFTLVNVSVIATPKFELTWILALKFSNVNFQFNLVFYEIAQIRLGVIYGHYVSIYLFVLYRLSLNYIVYYL